jgi:hypothetical protein
VIPVFDLMWHNMKARPGRGYPFLWYEYTWSADMFNGMEQEVHDPEENISVCSGGIGAAINCRMQLVNVVDDHEFFAIGMSGVHESPGAGAFTPYHGRRFLATKRIEPGAELYLSYGERYFLSREGYESVPMKKDYWVADWFVRRFRTLQVRTNIDESEELQSSLWRLVREIVQRIPIKDGYRLYGALPENIADLAPIMLFGGTSMQHYNESIRSLTWLEEHGRCMDNIKDGISKIPHAGRGAFANRFIAKGDLVAPAPLIHLPYRMVLAMYYDGAEKNGDVEEGTDFKQTKTSGYQEQLLVNYCFGHRDMTMLLCPYGMLTALINHGHGESANTQIRWSENMRHHEWLDWPVQGFEDEEHTGLSFDFVALRDIQEDDEVLIDYGDEWEDAWRQHVESFILRRPGYAPAFELNKRMDLQIQTIDEYDYDAEGIQIYCWNYYLKLQGVEPVMDKVEYSPCQVVVRTSSSNGSATTGNDDRYVAEIWEVELTKFGQVKHHITGVMFDVPRDAFYFVDMPYTRDHHQAWSFRHDMRIPDDLLPDAWKNLEKVEAQ